LLRDAPYAKMTPALSLALIWSGKGYVVPAVTFGTCLGIELVVRARFQDEKYYQTHGWPILAAFWLSATAVFFLSRRFVSRRELRDLATGELVVLQENHKFLFIHVRYWPAILFVLGPVLFVLAERGGL
jgi:hypothetical protein